MTLYNYILAAADALMSWIRDKTLLPVSVFSTNSAGDATVLEPVRRHVSYSLNKSTFVLASRGGGKVT